MNWINNESLRSWALNNGRATAKSGVSQLGLGDIVNYDWNGSAAGFDHVAIMTDATNYLVNSHSVDRKLVAWPLGGARSYLFTRINTYYTA